MSVSVLIMSIVILYHYNAIKCIYRNFHNTGVLCYWSSNTYFAYLHIFLFTRTISSCSGISKNEVGPGLFNWQRHKVCLFYVANKNLNKHIPRTLVGTVQDPKVIHSLTAAFYTRA